MYYKQSNPGSGKQPRNEAISLMLLHSYNTVTSGQYVCVPSLLLTIHCSTIPLVMIINFVFWALGRSEDSDGRVTWTLVSSQL